MLDGPPCSAVALAHRRPAAALDPGRGLPDRRDGWLRLWAARFRRALEVRRGDDRLPQQDAHARLACQGAGEAAADLSPLLPGVWGRLPEIVELGRIAAAELPRDRPHLHGLIALVAVRARRLRRHADGSRRADRADLLAEAHGQRAAGQQIELFDLVVEMARPLLEVRVGGDPDQRGSQLAASERAGQAAEFPGYIAARVGVVGVHDGELGRGLGFRGHAIASTRQRAVMPPSTTIVAPTTEAASSDAR